jgi:hypothetical protein
MKIKAIKQGKILQLPENLDLPDGQEILISIAESELLEYKFQTAHQQVIAEMKGQDNISLETEDDIINAAIKLTQ